MRFAQLWLCTVVLFGTDPDDPAIVQVLHGHGLLGREDGLYGAVSFAYQG